MCSSDLRAPGGIASQTTTVHYSLHGSIANYAKRGPTAGKRPSFLNGAQLEQIPHLRAGAKQFELAIDRRALNAPMKWRQIRKSKPINIRQRNANSSELRLKAYLPFFALRRVQDLLFPCRVRLLERERVGDHGRRDHADEAGKNGNKKNQTVDEAEISGPPAGCC